jgi:hypothetical protein
MEYEAEECSTLPGLRAERESVHGTGEVRMALARRPEPNP